MSEPAPIDSFNRESHASRSAAPQARAIGSPLSIGSSRRAQAVEEAEARRVPSAAPTHALPASTAGDESSAVQRAISVVRTVIPLVQRLLPLIDGNMATAVSNLLSPRPHAPAAQPAAPKIDLAPIKETLAEIQTQHQSLRDQVMEQNASFKRVEDQLELVREATDRNTLEQQELIEDLKSFSNKVKIVAIVAVGLLGIGIVLNLVLFLHIKSVLP